MSIKFELIFDEHSARKRIKSLYEYDARRDLQKHGKLSKLPLLADDFKAHDPTQEALRNVFSSPCPSTQVIPGSGGAGDKVGLKEGTAGDGPQPKSMVSESGSSFEGKVASKQLRFAEHVSPASASIKPISTVEKDSNVVFSKSESNDKRPITLASGSNEGVDTSSPNREGAGRKMGVPATSQQPDRYMSDRAPPSPKESDDE